MIAPRDAPTTGHSRPSPPQRFRSELSHQFQAQGGVTAGNLLSLLRQGRPVTSNRSNLCRRRWSHARRRTVPSPLFGWGVRGTFSGRERSCPDEPIQSQGSASTRRPGPCSHSAPEIQARPRSPGPQPAASAGWRENAARQRKGDKFLRVRCQTLSAGAAERPWLCQAEARHRTLR